MTLGTGVKVSGGEKETQQHLPSLENHLIILLTKSVLVFGEIS